ncbi:DUF2779 domain-containing protein [Luminiphilus sp.]|nr:DUF2779 domain-containing protein [Luminiphilus sp.]
MPQPKALTKSRFVMGLECPQKLIYDQDKRFRNLKREDSFLASLADGGFQVGEFAKAHFPGGHDIVTLNMDEAVKQTDALLSAGDCVIFEAAIRFQNCFIRVDVLEKKSDRLVIHEVKAKSFDSREDRPFLTQKGELSSKWQRYLYDVAFQKYVVSMAFPRASVTANLMLADKAARAPIDGLHQCFKVVSEGQRRSAKQVAAFPDAALDNCLLRSVPVDHECDVIYRSETHGAHFKGSFSSLVDSLSDVCAGKASPRFSLYKGCGECEFKSLGEEDDLLSGFNTCIAGLSGLSSTEPGDLIFDLWDNRAKDKQLQAGAIRLTDLTEEDVKNPEPRLAGEPLSRNQRQWLQIEKVRDKDAAPYIETLGLKTEMVNWQYPLHFIDFETTRAALPFFKDHTPYHNIAFQFSHHRMEADGTIAHANQFLLADAKINPNSEFVRALRDAVGGDDGTVFMYSNHEKTTLNAIHEELENETSQDARELQAFIESIAAPKKEAVLKWVPNRPMVDLLKVVKEFVYFPSTRGSNSLKAVLPAILNASTFLQRTYSQPIYGRGCEVSSLNIDARAWVKKDHQGLVINPYKQLPDLASDLSLEEQAELAGIDQIRDGGAALTAYARLMFEDLSPASRARIKRSLLEYCELDTLAMVFLYQGLLDLSNHQIQGLSDEMR